MTLTKAMKLTDIERAAIMAGRRAGKSTLSKYFWEAPRPIIRQLISVPSLIKELKKL